MNDQPFFDQILYDYLMCWVTTPYIYGGCSFYGIDCSGLVIETMKMMGLLQAHYDGTAKNLFDHFSDRGSELCVPQFGALVFFGRNDLLISHVAICLDHWRMVEAGGGDSTTKSREDAALAGAFVRARPIANRSDLFKIIMPKYYTPQPSPLPGKAQPLQSDEVSAKAAA